VPAHFLGGGRRRLLDELLGPVLATVAEPVGEGGVDGVDTEVLGHGHERDGVPVPAGALDSGPYLGQPLPDRCRRYRHATRAWRPVSPRARQEKWSVEQAVHTSTSRRPSTPAIARAARTEAGTSRAGRPRAVFDRTPSPRAAATASSSAAPNS